jgi:hypothetical protein
LGKKETRWGEGLSPRLRFQQPNNWPGRPQFRNIRPLFSRLYLDQT